MPYLKAKSEFNKEAANLLSDRSLYAPSIHCAYYSCFQLSKYIIKEKLNISYNQQSNEIRSTPGVQSHSYVVRKILDQIQIIDRGGYNEIRRKLSDLRLLREKSDYENIEINFTLSKRAIDYSNELRIYFTNKLL